MGDVTCAGGHGRRVCGRLVGGQQGVGPAARAHGPRGASPDKGTEHRDFIDMYKYIYIRIETKLIGKRTLSLSQPHRKKIFLIEKFVISGVKRIVCAEAALSVGWVSAGVLRGGASDGAAAGD